MGICCVATLLLTSVSSMYAYAISKDLTHAIGVFFCAYYLTKFAFFVLKSICVFKLLPNQNLSKKYGKWAVVTGCTDGIGKAYAIELSCKYKMNVVLISRTQSKLDELASQLKTETKTIAVDFSSTSNDIYEQVSAQIEGLDIGVLINNVGAGYDHPDYFTQVSNQDIDRVLAINCFPQTKMTHIILKGMNQRKRGLVVSLSSFSAIYPMPLLAVYSAAKEYNKYISECLKRENRHQNIVFQTIQPYFVTTKLSKIRRPSLLIPTAKNFATSAIRTAGHYDVTPGFFSQHLYSGMTLFLHGLPIVGQLVENITFGHLAGTMKRAYKKKASQKNQD